MLNNRQKELLQYIANQQECTSEQVYQYNKAQYPSLSKATIIRDLNTLLKQEYIIRKGKTKSVTYSINPHRLLTIPYDIEEYFSIDVDKRVLRYPSFSFDIFKSMQEQELFTDIEIESIVLDNQRYIKNRQLLSQTLIQKEIERITIEFAWKSSSIEGNTYTLLDTERLLKEDKEAQGKSKEEAKMIINHKTTLEYILNKPQEYKKLSIKHIEEIHTLLTPGLSITPNIRQRPVGILGTQYKPLDNIYQIKDALEQFITSINKICNPLAKALYSVLLLSYIQPFEDGNKRTARMLGNAILLAYDYCPLSYRSVDELEYKKATLLFYEQHSIDYFKKLFLEQYRHASTIYFR